MQERFEIGDWAITPFGDEVEIVSVDFSDKLKDYMYTVKHYDLFSCRSEEDQITEELFGFELKKVEK